MLYSNNLTNFVISLMEDGNISLDLQDDILVGPSEESDFYVDGMGGVLICMNGSFITIKLDLGYFVMSLTLTALIGSITVFVLAIFLGFELISKVPPTLHTPLMSGANAISGITIVGALILSNATFNGMDTSFAAILAFLALIMATINVVGGFMVTNRMLEMIAGKKRKGGK